MATAKKLPSGNWRVRAYIGKDAHGKPIYKSFTGTDKRAVERQAAAYADEHRDARRRNTFRDCVQRYIDSKSNILSPTTLDGYRSYAANWFAPLNDCDVEDVTNEMLQAFVNDLSARLSPKSVSNIYGFAAAVIYSVRPSVRFNVRLPQQQKVFKDLPQPAAIIAAVRGTDIELAVLLALWLGLRLSEIRGIKKEDIVNDVLTINRVKVQTSAGDVVKAQTKTYNSRRRLAVPPYLMELINRTDTEYVVPMSVQRVERGFKKALDAANIPLIRFHDLRHLNASVMLSLGVSDKYAMERGGWSNTAVLKGRYQHTFSDDRLESDRRIDDYFDSICHNI